MSSPLMLRLLSASVVAANRAGRVIREVMKSGELSVVDKGGNDPQTEADRKAQRCIVSTIATRFPDVRLHGEETLEPSDEDVSLRETGECVEVLKEACPSVYEGVSERDLIMWVDPLDGTSEFTEGYCEHVTVLIGIALGDKAVGGVIHQPFVMGPDNNMGRTVWGLIGLGVRGTNPSTAPLPPGTLRVVVTRSHFTEAVGKTLKAIEPTENLRDGGCGNKVLMVLENKAEAYLFPSRGTKRWDTCAGDAIVRAAGGVFTDIHGNDILYDVPKNKAVNETGLLVTMDTELHKKIVSKIPQSVKEEFPY